MPDLYDLPLKDIPKKTSIELMGFSTKKICNDMNRFYKVFLFFLKKLCINE